MSNKRVTFNDGFTTETAPAATTPSTASTVINTPSGNLTSIDVQSALNELQTDIDTRATTLALSSHESNTSNPHSVTKAQVGLGNVDNTSDMNKPTSTAQQSSINTAIANLVNSSPSTLDTLNELATALGNDPSFATTMSTSLGNRLRVDTASQGLDSTQKTNAKTNIDLNNVNNTSDANKPISTAQQTALDLKANIASPTFTGTVSGIDKTMVGLGNVDNTSDATKNSASATLTNKTINGSNNTITNISLSTGVTGTLPIANGGTNATSQQAPVSSICPIAYYDGTKITTDTTPAHLGYDSTTDSVYTSHLRVSSSDTQTAKFTNTASSSSTAGAGMSGFTDDGAAMSTGDRLAFYTFGGAKDSAHTTTNSAAITSFATENWGTSAAGANIKFEVTPNGSTTRNTALTINQDSSVSVSGVVESTTGGFKFPDGSTQLASYNYLTTALTSTSGSITISMAARSNFTHTMTENTTLANPTGMVAGMSGQIAITQHASSAKTLAFGSQWLSTDGTTPSISTTLNAHNIISWYAFSSNEVWFTLLKRGVA